MSYARFLTTDIYAFAHVDGFYICMWCSLMPPRQGRWIWEGDDEPCHDMPNDFTCDRLVELRAHVLEHIEAGDNVGSALVYIDEEIEEGCPYDKPVA